MIPEKNVLLVYRPFKEYILALPIYACITSKGATGPNVSAPAYNLLCDP